MVLRMMTKRKNKNYCSKFCAGLSALLLSAFPLSFVSCIDEDLSRCGVNYSVDYRLELSASLRQTLDQQLTTPAERQLAAALRSDMTDIMSERAAVMDLSFFTLEDGNLAQHQTVEPDANSLSMTIYMNRGDYHNIALAATHSVSEVTISGASVCARHRPIRSTHTVLLSIWDMAVCLWTMFRDISMCPYIWSTQYLCWL